MAKTNSKPVVYSALEVANICGVVNQTAINWIRNGYLKAYNTPGGQYRVYADDLAQFMRSRNMRLPQELKAACAEIEGEQKSILIVDDDKGLNDVIAAYFQKHFSEYLILQAFDGFEAGAAIAEKHPLCVVLDLDLPGVNGIELFHRINATEDFGKPVVIAITALTDQYPTEELKTTAFLKKPLALPELAEAVSKATNIPLAQ